MFFTHTVILINMKNVLLDWFQQFWVMYYFKIQGLFKTSSQIQGLFNTIRTLGTTTKKIFSLHNTWGQFIKETASVLFKSDPCFLSLHTLKCNKSLYKFLLQASNLYWQWYLLEFNFYMSKLYMHTAQKVHLQLVPGMI